MRNLDIKFEDGKVILSRETYEEIVGFCKMHGETDLPPFVVNAPDPDGFLRVYEQTPKDGASAVFVTRDTLNKNAH